MIHLCFSLCSLLAISVHGYVLEGVCCKYTHMLTYSDAQTHLGNTHSYFQFDYPWGSFLVSLPPSPVLNHDVCWNDEVEDVHMHNVVSLYHHFTDMEAFTHLFCIAYKTHIVLAFIWRICHLLVQGQWFPTVWEDFTSTVQLISTWRFKLFNKGTYGEIFEKCLF